METKKQTYLEWFKEKYQFGWVIAIAILFTIASISEFNSDYSNNGWIPVICGTIIYGVIFLITFYQYKKGGNTKFQ
jgi:hypothetical protein